MVVVDRKGQASQNQGGLYLPSPLAAAPAHTSCSNTKAKVNEVLKNFFINIAWCVSSFFIHSFSFIALRNESGHSSILIYTPLFCCLSLAFVRNFCVCVFSCRLCVLGLSSAPTAPVIIGNPVCLYVS